MRKEFEQLKQMKYNPMADQKTLRELWDKLQWYNLNTMSEEEKEVIR